LIKWLDTGKTSLQHDSNLPQTKAWRDLMTLVKRKGTKAKMTVAAGMRTVTRGRSQVSVQLFSEPPWGKVVCHELPHLSLRFASEPTTENCVPFSLLGVLGASKKSAKRLRKALKTTICGLRDLPGWPRCLAWAARRRAAVMLLMLQGVHCVGIDCMNGYIYDPAQKNKKVLALSEAALLTCGFTDSRPLQIRRVHS
jgi:hypothetical protein